MDVADGKENVFVLGMDDFNRAKLETMRGSQGIRFIPLLSHPQVQGADAYPVATALQMCRERLAAFPGPIDAIMGYWDFPVTLLVPLLGREFGVPTPSFESVLRCEHKYWNRVIGRRVAPAYTPGFRVVDPFDDGALEALDLTPPFWLKPIKSADAELAFRIRHRQELQRAVPAIRERIGRFAEPFDLLLDLGQMPPEISRVGGRFCLAEEEISGRQCTVEGYVLDGKAHVHGIIDSHRYPGVSSFLSYEYPSRLPHALQDRIADVARRLVEGVGLESTTWNVEFFVNERTGGAWILELNPRLSQSHAHMFDLVDGASNLEIAVALALGRRPDFPNGEGVFRRAAKFYLRVFEDAVLERVPNARDIERIEERLPGTRVHVTVPEGARLSDLWGQDSYSYRLADIHLGGESPEELTEKFRICRTLLPFRLAPVPDASPTRLPEKAYRARAIP